MSSDITLGTPPTAEQQRDAIHVAVIAVFADNSLQPGTHVGFSRKGDTQWVSQSDNSIGVIDPFLREPVQCGSLCWLLLYPNTIHGMRHHWQHPAFDKADIERTASSREWLQSFATECEVSYDWLIGVATDAVVHGGGCVGGEEHVRDRIRENRVQFWRCFEEVTGLRVRDPDDIYFSCAC